MQGFSAPPSPQASPMSDLSSQTPNLRAWTEVHALEFLHSLARARGSKTQNASGRSRKNKKYIHPIFSITYVHPPPPNVPKNRTSPATIQAEERWRCWWQPTWRRRRASRKVSDDRTEAWTEVHAPSRPKPTQEASKSPGEMGQQTQKMGTPDVARARRGAGFQRVVSPSVAACLPCTSSRPLSASDQPMSQRKPIGKTRGKQLFCHRP